MTPGTIGQLLDSLAGGDPASIVSAGLSMIIGDEVRCEILGGDNPICVLYVHGNLADQVQKLKHLALQIRRLDDYGSNAPGVAAFNDCEVWIRVA